MALGRPVPSCQVRVIVGFGKGKKLRGTPFRRDIDAGQAKAAVAAAASQYFAGFTVTSTRGVFFRQGEPGVALDIYRTQYDPPGCAALVRKARCLASDIRHALRQHSVLVVANDPSSKTPLTADIVTKGSGGRCDVGSRTAARRDASKAAADTY